MFKLIISNTGGTCFSKVNYSAAGEGFEKLILKDICSKHGSGQQLDNNDAQQLFDLQLDIDDAQRNKVLKLPLMPDEYRLSSATSSCSNSTRVTVAIHGKFTFPTERNASFDHMHNATAFMRMEVIHTQIAYKPTVLYFLGSINLRRSKGREGGVCQKLHYVQNLGSAHNANRSTWKQVGNFPNNAYVICGRPLAYVADL